METEQQLVAEVAHLKRELATSNKLAGLRKEGAEAAKKRTAELEGIIRAMTVGAVRLTAMERGEPGRRPAHAAISYLLTDAAG